MDTRCQRHRRLDLNDFLRVSGTSLNPLTLDEDIFYSFVDNDFSSDLANKINNDVRKKLQPSEMKKRTKDFNKQIVLWPPSKENILSFEIASPIPPMLSLRASFKKYKISPISMWQ